LVHNLVMVRIRAYDIPNFVARDIHLYQYDKLLSG